MSPKKSSKPTKVKSGRNRKGGGKGSRFFQQCQGPTLTLGFDVGRGVGGGVENTRLRKLPICEEFHLTKLPLRQLHFLKN